MRVLITGDIHGDLPRYGECVRAARACYGIDAAIQLGDFGFFAPLVEDALSSGLRFAVPVHVLDGNHEDHAWLARELRSGSARQWCGALNLVYHPRGSIAEFGSSVVGFVGGALHADRPQEHNPGARFPNYILAADRVRAEEQFSARPPDLIATHSCPAGIGVGMRGDPGFRGAVALHIRAAGFDPGPDDDCGEIELARLWRALAVKPRAWVFGHFHRRHEALVQGVRFQCEEGDLTSPGRSILLWDTEEKKLLRCPADPEGGETG